MRQFLSAVIGTLLLSSASFAAKPSASPPNPQVAYRALSGNSVKLMVADENGANASALYASPTSFNFDLAPRAQRQIAITDNTQLKLLTYTQTGSGSFATSGVVTLASNGRGGSVDFSPDGRKIAYKCCWDGQNEKLVVHDLVDNSVTEWATGPFFWDFAWFRDGASIAYATHGPAELYELSGPGAVPQLLYSSGQGQLYVDSARTHPDRLVLSSNKFPDDAVIGLWQAPTVAEPTGHFIDGNLANSTRSWQGTLSCEDRKLAYMGVQNTSGSQAFYIRDLSTGLVSLFSKNSNILLQFWPTCN